MIYHDKFSVSLYLDIHNVLSESIHTWTIGTRLGSDSRVHVWGGGGGAYSSKSRTSLRIVFSVLFFTTLLRNHSYLYHRYSISFAMYLMTLNSRGHNQGDARGQN